MATHIFLYVVDSIGGELMWAGGLSLMSDIPWKAHWPLKSHVFMNAGRLDRLDLGALKGSLPNQLTYSCVDSPQEKA